MPMRASSRHLLSFNTALCRCRSDSRSVDHSRRPLSYGYDGIILLIASSKECHYDDDFALVAEREQGNLQ